MQSGLCSHSHPPGAWQGHWGNGPSHFSPCHTCTYLFWVQGALASPSETEALFYPRFLPGGWGQHSGRSPEQGASASQELRAPSPQPSSLGAALPPSSCSQQAGPGPGSHAAVLLPGEPGGRSELCREKAWPVKVSEMNRRRPRAAGLRRVSALVLCLRMAKPSEVQGQTHYSLVRGP